MFFCLKTYIRSRKKGATQSRSIHISPRFYVKPVIPVIIGKTKWTPTKPCNSYDQKYWMPNWSSQAPEQWGIFLSNHTVLFLNSFSTILFHCLFFSITHFYLMLNARKRSLVIEIKGHLTISFQEKSLWEDVFPCWKSTIAFTYRTWNKILKKWRSLAVVASG